MSDTKQSELKRDEKGRFNGGTPPAGFNVNPQNRHNGVWKKTDSPRYKLEQMMKLSTDELKKVVQDKDAPLFEKKLADAIYKGDWKVIKEMIEQVYGKAPQSIDVTTGGEPMRALVEFLPTKEG